jgi:SAM-dependent methyltransferase
VAIDDHLLLEFYRARSGPDARWNLSPEAAFLDYRLRTWFQAYLPPRRKPRVCNIGIGAGEWDDFIGYALERVDGTLTSVDSDREICDLFEYRQGREEHPNPARVICCDALQSPSELEKRFDMVTIIGSTVREIGNYEGTLAACSELLKPGGVLFYSDFYEFHAPELFESVATEFGLHRIELREASDLPRLRFYLAVGERMSDADHLAIKESKALSLHRS